MSFSAEDAAWAATMHAKTLKVYKLWEPLLVAVDPCTLEQDMEDHTDFLLIRQAQDNLLVSERCRRYMVGQVTQTAWNADGSPGELWTSKSDRIAYFRFNGPLLEHGYYVDAKRFFRQERTAQMPDTVNIPNGKGQEAWGWNLSTLRDRGLLLAEYHWTPGPGSR